MRTGLKKGGEVFRNFPAFSVGTFLFLKPPKPFIWKGFFYRLPRPFSEVTPL